GPSAGRPQCILVAARSRARRAGHGYLRAQCRSRMMEHAGEKTVAMQLRPASSSASLVRTTISTLGKDLRLEWRSKDALNAMLFFALLVVVIFSFAFEPTAEEARRITGGLVWVAFLFSSTMALNQSWARELRHQSPDA